MTASTSRFQKFTRFLIHQRYEFRLYLSEFISTFIFLLGGLGAVAQVTLSGGYAGDFLTITLAFGLGITFAIYAGIKISGAHLNPAITFMFAVFEGFPWRRVPGYMISQLLGAFTSAAVVYGIYFDAITHFDGGHREVVGPLATSMIFYTHPQPYLSYATMICDQIFATALLALLFYPIYDARNARPQANLAPVFFALAVVLVGLAFGFNTGYAINPARDLGPRLFTAIVYGPRVFTVDRAFFWIPATMPFVGIILGASIYKLFLVFQERDRRYPLEKPPEDDSQEAHDRSHSTADDKHTENAHHSTQKLDVFSSTVLDDIDDPPLSSLDLV